MNMHQLYIAMYLWIMFKVVLFTWQCLMYYPTTNGMVPSWYSAKGKQTRPGPWLLLNELSRMNSQVKGVSAHSISICDVNLSGIIGYFLGYA